MDLYTDMLFYHKKRLSSSEALKQAQLEADRWIEMDSFRALARIKAILEDDSLRDDECFSQIEEIVNIFEELGSGCGSRHDFG